MISKYSSIRIEQNRTEYILVSHVNITKITTIKKKHIKTL